jgi:hypothetical protein
MGGCSQLVSLDELTLGLGVGLAVVLVARGERLLEGRVLIHERWVCAQAVAEAQTTLELLALIHEVQMVGTVRGCGVAEKAPMRKCRVEGTRELVAGSLDQPGDRRVKIRDERHHVDHGLCRETGDSSRADVVDIHTLKQRCESPALRLEGGRPRGVVSDNLHRSVTSTC